MENLRWGLAGALLMVGLLVFTGSPSFLTLLIAYSITGSAVTLLSAVFNASRSNDGE